MEHCSTCSCKTWSPIKHIGFRKWRRPPQHPCCKNVSGSVCLLQGYLSINFSGTFYELAQRHSDVPRLTEKQKEALRFFSALASSDKLRMDYLLQPGDIQLLNNLNQQHQRSSYQVFAVLNAASLEGRDE